MNLIESVYSFIKKPFPLWERELTRQLVSAQWDTLEKFSLVPEEYSTARSYFKDAQLLSSEKTIVNILPEPVYIEYPQPELMGTFYSETGLRMMTRSEVSSVKAVEKIKGALNALAKVPGVLECISQLVKCICILRQDDPEVDTSHSDPSIPFTIFVSVCEDTSEVSNMRVAESILHEAMHLKLTMIEHHVDLIIPGTRALSYSPWRDEDRPVRGVMHGLFVFAAVRNFHHTTALGMAPGKSRAYAHNRLVEINGEFELLNSFEKSTGLSDAGKMLVKLLAD